MLQFQSLLVLYLFLRWEGLGFDGQVDAFCLSEILSCKAGQNRAPRQSEHVIQGNSHCPVIFKATSGCAAELQPPCRCVECRVDTFRHGAWACGGVIFVTPGTQVFNTVNK